ncbi:TRI10 protein, partial [Psilopogon haemacephalus]|nr:TRI10 protein [Psilopogon haemacephalus]
EVTLDPATAHPCLLLSPDLRSMRWEYPLRAPPGGPQRFAADPCALGLQSFSRGRHCWVVDLARSSFCAVGVSRESLPRERPLSFHPREGIWALQQWGDQSRALTHPPTPLALPRVPKRVRVSLDYEWGLVTFFDLDNQSLIYTFPPASFGGERLRP